MKYLIPLVTLLFCTIGHAQETIIFTAEATSGTESLIPRLTWSTQPAAVDCIASGDWTGIKSGAGDEVLLAITSSANYMLTCNWESFGTITVSWTAPTKNTDGTVLTDLDHYNLYYGVVSGDYPNLVTDVPANVTTYVIENLTPNNYYVVGTAVNILNIESVFSNEATKTIDILTNSRSVSIAINPKPNPMGSLLAQ